MSATALRAASAAHLLSRGKHLNTQTITQAAWPDASESIALIDRRAHPRVESSRAGKIFRRDHGIYAAGRARDESDSGALIECASVRPFEPGEEVEVAIVESASHLLREHHLRPAVVVRAEAIGPGRERHAVALRYLEQRS